MPRLTSIPALVLVCSLFCAGACDSPAAEEGDADVADGSGSPFVPDDGRVAAVDRSPPESCPDGGAAALWGWCWHAPRPHGYAIDAIAQPTSDVRWILADYGDVLIREDAAGAGVIWNRDSWRSADFHGPSPLQRGIVTAGKDWVITFGRTSYTDGSSDIVFALSEVGVPVLVWDSLPCRGIGWLSAASPDAIWYTCHEDEAWRLFSLASDTLVEHELPSGIVEQGSRAVRGLVSVAADEIWLSTTTHVARYLGGEWDTAALPVRPKRPGPDQPTSMDMYDANLFVAMSNNEILQYDETLSLVRRIPGPDTIATPLGAGVVAVGLDELWLSEGGLLHHWNGSRWQIEATVRPDAYDITDGQVTMAIDDTLYELASGTLVPLGQEQDRWLDVWAGPDGTAALVGTANRFAVWDGASWHRERLTKIGQPRHIVGWSLETLYVTTSRRVWRRSGDDWAPVPLPLGADEFTVGVAPEASTRTMWFLTRDAVYAHDTVTGETRTFERPPEGRHVGHLTVSPEGDVWVAGQRTVWRLRDATWQAPDEALEDVAYSLRSMVATSDALWILHDRGFYRWTESDGLEELGHHRWDAGTVATSGGATWFAGDSGTITRHRGGTTEAFDPRGGEDFMASDTSESGIWLVSGQGTVVEIRPDDSIRRHRMGGAPDIGHWDHVHVSDDADYWFIDHRCRWARWRDGAWFTHGVLPNPAAYGCHRRIGQLGDDTVVVRSGILTPDDEGGWSKTSTVPFFESDYAAIDFTDPDGILVSGKRPTRHRKLVRFDGSEWSLIEGLPDDELLSQGDLLTPEAGWLETFEIDPPHSRTWYRLDGDEIDPIELAEDQQGEGTLRYEHSVSDGRQLWFVTGGGDWYSWTDGRLYARDVPSCERPRSAASIGAETWLVCNDGVSRYHPDHGWRVERMIGAEEVRLTEDRAFLLTERGILTKSRDW